ncbi:MAG TPA: Fur family transcriptional regulator [Ktedonobacterales bacterium]|jgi:Fur family ferric uptake transcriptional regulator|nr:Fur family transcriptional regulator [Ktedonobacterales bacterium]
MTILDRLSQAGYKLTTPRRRILDALRASETPLTALEVAARSGVSVASTYRALSLLADLGVVSEISDPPVERTAGHVAPGDSAADTTEADARGRRYAMCTATGHHHHFTCRACHATLDVSSAALETALAEIEQATGARIERHDIILGGLCAACKQALAFDTTEGQA